MSKSLCLSLLMLPLLIYWRNPAWALFAGCLITLVLAPPTTSNAPPIGKLALQSAIVLLGLSLNAEQMWRLSSQYSSYITVYVVLTLLAGLALGKLLKVDRKCSELISSGTAICGGTAVASLSPVLRAQAQQTGAILAIIFILNAVALLIFPMIGRALALDQSTFGLWCALAIHDTASVVATASLYGEEAAQVATTVKLGRTLWLIPLLLVFSALYKEPSTKLRIPLFIVLFIIAACINSVLTLPDLLLATASGLSKVLLVIALFFIGTEIHRDTLRSIPGRVLIQALVLWFAVLPLTLGFLLIYH